MVKTGSAEFLRAAEAWLQAETEVRSAVLFGSGARAGEGEAGADTWSDLDLHVITTAPARLEQVDWAQAFPGQGFCLQVARPATGGVRKVTVIFAAGQIDLVIVPVGAMRLVRLALALGLQRRVAPVRIALNEMATCLATGYRFLKGESRWGKFYARVATTMTGVRLTDRDLQNLGDAFLCEMLWIFQKIARGELLAAQHALHRQLAETNFRLLRELRLRRGRQLPSFGLGRRLEQLLPADELAWMKVEARPEPVELRRAVWRAGAGLRAMMRELLPGWTVPAPMEKLLLRHSVETSGGDAPRPGATAS